MNESEQLQRLEAELRRTADIIDYLEYQLMGKRAWKRETEFKIAKFQSLSTKVKSNED